MELNILLGYFRVFEAHQSAQPIDLRPESLVQGFLVLVELALVLAHVAAPLPITAKYHRNRDTLVVS